MGYQGSGFIHACLGSTQPPDSVHGPCQVCHLTVSPSSRTPHVPPPGDQMAPATTRQLACLGGPISLAFCASAAMLGYLPCPQSMSGLPTSYSPPPSKAAAKLVNHLLGPMDAFSNQPCSNSGKNQPGRNLNGILTYTPSLDMGLERSDRLDEKNAGDKNPKATGSISISSLPMRLFYSVNRRVAVSRHHHQQQQHQSHRHRHHRLPEKQLITESEPSASTTNSLGHRDRVRGESVLTIRSSPASFVLRFRSGKFTRGPNGRQIPSKIDEWSTASVAPLEPLLPCDRVHSARTDFDRAVTKPEVREDSGNLGPWTETCQKGSHSRNKCQHPNRDGVMGRSHETAGGVGHEAAAERTSKGLVGGEGEATGSEDCTCVDGSGGSSGSGGDGGGGSETGTGGISGNFAGGGADGVGNGGDSGAGGSGGGEGSGGVEGGGGGGGSGAGGGERGSGGGGGAAGGAGEGGGGGERGGEGEGGEEGGRAGGGEERG
ncbi:unnamed protein product, partial [Protopolystoma xenopodis]